jgi:hypothetical protein
VIGEYVDGNQHVGDEALETIDRESHLSNWSTVSPVSKKVRVTSVLP